MYGGSGINVRVDNKHHAFQKIRGIRAKPSRHYTPAINKASFGSSGGGLTWFSLGCLNTHQFFCFLGCLSWCHLHRCWRSCPPPRPAWSSARWPAAPLSTAAHPTAARYTGQASLTPSSWPLSARPSSVSQQPRRRCGGHCASSPTSSPPPPWPLIHLATFLPARPATWPLVAHPATWPLVARPATWPLVARPATWPLVSRPATWPLVF